MKTMYVVAVKDELTNTFLQPTFGENLLALQRLFEYQINNIDLWKANPADFSLYKLGTFEEETGIFVSNIEKLAGGRSVWKGETE